jgi:hypothetical protein
MAHNFPRDESAVARRCARPTCGRPPSASMTYDYRARTIYVIAVLDERHPAYYDLCEEHASSLVPPRGWACRNERTELDVCPRLSA